MPAEVPLACPDCGRAMRPLPFMRHGTQVVTRKCACGRHWQLVAEPLRPVKGGFAHKFTWAELANDPDILSNPAKQARERLITSQWYLDPRIVAEKRRERDYEVLVSEPFEYEGETFRLVLDGHHSLRAAIQDAAEPIFLEATGQQDDSRRLLATQGPEAYLASHQDGVDWRDAFTGHPIW